jgi:polysaccharide pyruvyl transferase WcaK-like protein
MTKILITGTYTSLNNGTMAMVVSTVKALRKSISDACFVLLSNCPETDKKRYEQYRINVVERIWRRGEKGVKSQLLCLMVYALLSLFRCVMWRVYKFFNLNLKLKGTLGEYVTADAIIDLSGDSLSDDYGTLPLCEILYSILLGIIVKKPVIIYAQSIGPFKKQLTRTLTKFILNRVNMITVREKITKNYLQEFGINKPSIYLTADSAFLLESASVKTVDKILMREGLAENNKIRIGISPSRIIHRWSFLESKSLEEKHERYIELMAEITDYLIEKLNATVILIPHVMIPNNDDRVTSKEIYERVKNKHDVKLIMNEYTAEEMKGIIGRCDMFIGCRMHATIASTSTCIPTISIAYSHKTHGIIGEMLGQEEFVVDVRNSSFDSLLSGILSKIDILWSEREHVKVNLRQKIKEIQNSALYNAELTANLIKSSGGTG